MRNLAIAVVLVLALVLVFTAFRSDETDESARETGSGSTVTSATSDTDLSGSAVDGAATNAAQNPDAASEVDTRSTADAIADAPVLHTLHGQVRDVAGAPISGARLRFVIGTEEQRTAGVTESDEEGLFQLGVTEEGPGVVHAEKERYATEQVPWQPSADGTQATGREGEPLLIVLSGETAIGGRVTLPDGLENGEYIIVIQKYSGPRAYHEPVVHKFDNAEGEYYAATGDGQRRVWAYAPGSFRSPMLTFPLADGEQRLDVDFALQEGCDIKGQCYDKQTGKPVSSVMAYSPTEHVPGTVNFLFRNQIDASVRNAAHSDAAGTFHLQDLPPGEHLLRFLHPDYKPVDQVVTLTAGSTPEIEVALEEGTGIVGEVLDAEGQAPEEAIVLAIVMGPDMETGQQTAGNVDEEGQYAIKNLAPGAYIVVLVDEGASDGQPRFTMSQVGPERDTVVDFVEIPEKAIVTGKVTNLDGEPVVGATMLFMSGESDDDFTFKSAVTDEEGVYEIRNLALGRHQIGIGLRPGGTFAVNSFITLEQPKDYVKDLVFHNLTFHGKVRDAKTRKAVRGELLLLSATVEEGNPAEFQGRAELEPDGTFEISGVLPGQYYAIVLSQGYQPAVCDPFEIDEKANRKVSVDFDVIVGATVEFLVVDADGQPVDAASVYIMDSSGELANPGLPPLTASGRYKFANLTPGTFTARIKPREGEVVEKQFEARVGETTRVDVKLP